MEFLVPRSTIASLFYSFVAITFGVCIPRFYPTLEYLNPHPCLDGYYLVSRQNQRGVVCEVATGLRPKWPSNNPSQGLVELWE
jgi:hypothetical protein